MQMLYSHGDRHTHKHTYCAKKRSQATPGLKFMKLKEYGLISEMKSKETRNSTGIMASKTNG